MTTPPVPPAVGEPPLTDAELAAAVEAVNALQNAFAFNSRDWAKHKDDAWHYGIILGWDHEPEFDGDDNGAMEQLAERFHWTPDDVENLRRQHRGFEALPRLVASLRSAREERDQAQGDLKRARHALAVVAELRNARLDKGEYYDLAQSARRLADEITTLWAVAEDEQLSAVAAVLRAIVPGTDGSPLDLAHAAAERIAAAERELALQRLERCCACNHHIDGHHNGANCEVCDCPTWHDHVGPKCTHREALAADVPAAACNHCHDDPPAGHTCPTCGRGNTSATPVFPTGEVIDLVAQAMRDANTRDAWIHPQIMPMDHFARVAIGKLRELGWGQLADDHYLSTACYHGHHNVCGEAQHAHGDPSEPHCKFCETPCSCPKHADPLAPCEGGERKRRHHPSCARPDDDSHIGWCGPNGGFTAAGEAEVTQP